MKLFSDNEKKRNNRITMKTKSKLHLMIMSALKTPSGLARQLKFDRAKKYDKLCATN